MAVSFLASFGAAGDCSLARKERGARGGRDGLQQRLLSVFAFRQDKTLRKASTCRRLDSSHVRFRTTPATPSTTTPTALSTKSCTRYVVLANPRRFYTSNQPQYTSRWADPPLGHNADNHTTRSEHFVNRRPLVRTHRCTPTFFWGSSL